MGREEKMSIKIDAAYLYDINDLLKNTTFLLTGGSVVSSEIQELGVRRKCILETEVVNESAIDVSNSVVEVFTGVFEAVSNEAVIFSNDEINLRVVINNLDAGVLYHYKLLAEIQTPEVAKKSPEVVSESAIRESEILSLRFVFCSSDFELNRVDELSYVYDSYNELGFFATDIDKLNKFFNESDMNIGNDLIEEFTTTELAGSIFDEGLGILCWGGTPWTYFVRSENDFTIYGDDSGYEGNYYLREDIIELSIIPGQALRNWSHCNSITWPKLKIFGDGKYVSAKVLVKNELVTPEREKLGFFSPIPTYLLIRHNDSSSVSPLLYSKIL
ncbi:hypothetical protein KW530_21470 [Vibrio fluvialis]|nr:hypothetical protein [Vibrio fluvialis]MBY7942434.1 hypothetical protein [Vibrio fluvialis]MBY8169438.1 hypothetical protein [Vibrio fluvialis]MBY8259267.1 hypothetical protein [Vibrio fluvialis]MBY8267673.1 hypothetical protein [Vibrio fluvialis]